MMWTKKKRLFFLSLLSISMVCRAFAINPATHIAINLSLLTEEGIFLAPKTKGKPTDEFIFNALKVQTLVLKEALDIMNSNMARKTGPDINEPGIGIGCESTTAHEVVLLQRLNKNWKYIAKETLQDNLEIIEQSFQESLKETRSLADYMAMTKEKRKDHPWFKKLATIKEINMRNNSFNKNMMFLLNTWPEKIDDEALADIFYRAMMKILTDTRVFTSGQNRLMAMGTDPLVLVNFNPDHFLTGEKKRAQTYVSKTFATDYLRQLKIVSSQYVRKKMLDLAIMGYARHRDEAKIILSPAKDLAVGFDWSQYDTEILAATKMASEQNELSIIKTPKLGSLYFSLYDVIRNGVAVNLRCFASDTYLISGKEEDKIPFASYTYAPSKELASYKRSDYVFMAEPHFPLHTPIYTVNLYCPTKTNIQEFLQTNKLDFFDLLMFNAVNYQVERSEKNLEEFVKFFKKEESSSYLRVHHFYQEILPKLIKRAQELKLGFLHEKKDEAVADVLHIQSLQFGVDDKR